MKPQTVDVPTFGGASAAYKPRGAERSGGMALCLRFMRLTAPKWDQNLYVTKAKKMSSFQPQGSFSTKTIQNPMGFE